MLLVKRVFPSWLHNAPTATTTTTTTTTTTLILSTTAPRFVVMPPKRRAAATKSAPAAADVDAPAAKRQKPTAAPVEIGKMMKDDEGNPSWTIGGRDRRVAVSEYKGNQLVAIREHYEKDGKTLPGKKGISLSVEQLNAFISILPQLEKYLASKEVTIGRPVYADPTEEEPAAALEEEADEDEDEDEGDEDEDDEHKDDEEEVVSEEDASEEEEAKKKTKGKR
ncbi:transcriptional Coactivator p15-domain-containing protein [Morchella snyderi]|nr:transcriptional Coactivator p15-domain-containing protein [Morchella snyderi]